MRFPAKTRLFLLMWTWMLGLTLGGAPAAFSIEPGGVSPQHLPERMKGWERTGLPIRYTSETLFERINGAAEAYLKSGFLELWVAEYTKGTQGPVTVELYRHDAPILAFGIYSQERWPEARFLDTQGLAWMDPDQRAAGFWAGPWYVKISALDPDLDFDEFESLVFQVKDGFDQDPGPLAVFKYFPQDKRIPFSERFQSRDFLGYPFFRQVYSLDYDLGQGRQVSLFAVSGESEKQIRSILEKYLGKGSIQPGRLSHDDPYQGRVELHWIGHWLLGAVSPHNDPESVAMLELLAAGPWDERP